MPLLTVGSQYPTLLEIGFLSRHKTGVAATAQILMLQMGDDESFYQMLKEKNLMQVTVADKSVNFGLSGTSDAFDKLETCASLLGTGQAYHDNAPQPTDVTAQIDNMDTTGSLGAQSLQYAIRDEIESLRAENRQLMLENQAIAARMEREQKSAPPAKTDDAELQKLLAENKKLKDALAEEKSRADMAELQIKEVIAEKEVLLQEVKASEVPDAEPVTEFVTEEISEKIPEQMSENIPDDIAPSEMISNDVETVADVVVEVDTSEDPPLSVITPRSKPKNIKSIVSAVVEKNKTTPPVSISNTASAKVNVTSSALYTQRLLPRLLDQMGVTATAQGKMYTWNNAGVYSAAQEQTLAHQVTAMDVLTNYTENAKTRCTGDFAHKVGVEKDVSGFHIVSAEMACLGDGIEAAAAVLFVKKDQQMVIVSHEGPAQNMPEALTQRDVILSRLSAQ